MGGELDGIIFIIIFFLMLLFLPPIILAIIGWAIYKRKPERAKVLFICAAVYLVVGLGICGMMMN